MRVTIKHRLNGGAQQYMISDSAKDIRYFFLLLVYEKRVLINRTLEKKQQYLQEGEQKKLVRNRK